MGDDYMIFWRTRSPRRCGKFLCVFVSVSTVCLSPCVCLCLCRQSPCPPHLHPTIITRRRYWMSQTIQPVVPNHSTTTIDPAPTKGNPVFHEVKPCCLRTCVQARSAHCQTNPTRIHHNVTAAPHSAHTTLALGPYHIGRISLGPYHHTGTAPHSAHTTLVLGPYHTSTRPTPH